ncbi:unnamed protein product [Rotaria sp. Silwood2]|nr:unnamed protein product [Rotaria sp. Silwood2]
MSSLLTYSNHIIIFGDFNAKHTQWGCSTINSKGDQLAQWINVHNLIIHNPNMPTSLRSPTTIDLIISNDQQGSVDCSLLPYNCSDHYPIFIAFSNILLTTNQQQLISKTYWNVFRAILSVIHEHIEELYNDITDEFQIFIHFQHLLQALKSRVTIWTLKQVIRPTLPASIRILVNYKHYLTNRYRKTRLENDRLDLRLWSSFTRQEIRTHRARTWNSFISKIASPNPSTFWKNVKLLYKKPTINFTGITDDDNITIHKTPQAIISYVQQHFEKRFAPHIFDPKNKLDSEATKLWEQLVKMNHYNSIQEPLTNSDLKFTINDISVIIKSLANKKSSSFDRISNHMIKLIPSDYYRLLIDQYNKLFATVKWEKQWKCSRLLCFNKVTSPVPATSQLRPINLLPVFSKIYEKLFLIRFNSWLSKNNILPPQQSGSRKNQSIATRVQHLLQQLTQSMTYNSISTVIYIDFLQAYDRLWQKGLLLKLANLQCPRVYMQWIINYFIDRTCIIDIDGHLSQLINMHSGVPQGSCFSSTAFIVYHYDLPDIFDQPENCHLFVDDLAIVYTPSIFLSFQQQLLMLERKMNNEMNNLLNYTQKWHQPVNPAKCEFVIYYTCVKPPKINLYFNSLPIKQVKQFQYLGYLLDHRLSFNNFIKQQINKMNNGLRILKYIHNKFPTFFKLKYRFFSAFIWPHFTFISTIYVLCSPGTQGKCHSFYRKCLRIIFRLPYTSNRDLHEYLKLPTLANRFHTIIQRRLYNIQHHESSLLNTIYQYHRLKSIFQQHYTKQKCIPNLLTGRPRQRIRQFYQNDKSTLFDKLLSFCNE